MLQSFSEPQLSQRTRRVKAQRRIEMIIRRAFTSPKPMERTPVKSAFSDEGDKRALCAPETPGEEQDGQGRHLQKTP